MATRLKTVEYAYPLTSTLVDNTLTALTTITLSLPESSKVFRSVVFRVSLDDTNTATGSIASRRVDFGLGAVAAESYTNTQAVANSGESLSIVHTVNLTSYFTTNWTGTSMTAPVSVLFDTSGTTPGFRNVSATLEITYEFDDTSATHLKTVHIPLTSPTGAIATGGTSIDTIPLLDTFCPEASKVFRDAFLVVEGNTSGPTTTDSTLTVSVGGAAQTGFVHEMGLLTDRYIRNHNKLAAADGSGLTFSTAGTQAVAATSAGAARYHHITFTLVVTYEFDRASTTSVLNSLLIPGPVSPVPMLAAGQREGLDVWIEEPNPVIVKSAMRMVWETSGSATEAMRVQIAGAGALTAYTQGSPGTLAGSLALQAGFGATEFTLARGRNIIGVTLGHSGTDGQQGFNPSLLWILNYTSDVHADGIWSHNHTVRHAIAAISNSSLAALTSMAFAPTIPEAAVFYNSIGFDLAWLMANAVYPPTPTVDVALTSGENGLGGTGYQPLLNANVLTDFEVGVHHTYFDGFDVFQRWTGDPGAGRADVETSRTYRAWFNAFGNSGAVYHLDSLITYHSMTYAVAGTLTRYAGDGSAITVDVHRVDTDEKVATTTTAAGGGFSATWFDDTVQVYCQAQEDGSHVGRSANAVAV